MLRYVETQILDEKYSLFLNIFALYEIRDKYGEDALDKISDATFEAVKLSTDIFILLTCQADQMLSEFGLPGNPKIDKQRFINLLDPNELEKVKMAIFMAVNAGLGLDIPQEDDDKPKDLILMQIDAAKSKKKE